MIDGMRKFARSRIAQVGLLFLGAGLAFFGVNNFDFAGPNLQGGVLSRIGGREVTVNEIDRAVRDAVAQVRNEQNKTITAADLVKSGDAQGIIWEAEQRNTLLAYADKMGMSASSEALRPYLEQNKALVDEFGKVSRERFLAAARNRDQTPKQFEALVRDYITMDYVRSAAGAAMHVPEVLTQPWISYLGESRTLSLAQVTNATVGTPAEPTDAEVQAWYTAHLANFKQEERRRISVLTYSPDDFIDKVPLTDEQLKAEYQKRIKDYSTPETREIVEFESADRNAVQNFIDLTVQGVTVEEALKQSPGVSRTSMTVKPADVKDENYSKLLFGLALNKVVPNPYQVKENDPSQPWKTAMVVKSSPGVPTPLEQIADKVRRDVVWNDAVSLYDKSAEDFLSAAGGQSLEDIGKQFGFPVITLAPVDERARTMGGDQAEILIKNADMLAQLFKLRVGDMTNVVEGDNVRTMFRLDEIIAPYTQKLEDVKAQVKEAIRIERVTQAADKAAEAMAAAVKAGTAFDKAAAANRLTMISQPVTMIRAIGDRRLDPAVIGGAFELKAGEVGVLHDRNGTPWVARVDKVEPATPQTTALFRAQLAGQINQSLQQDLSEVFARGLTSEVDYKRDDAAIESFLKRLAGGDKAQ